MEAFTRGCVTYRWSIRVLCARGQRLQPRPPAPPHYRDLGNVLHPSPKAAHLHALNVLQQDISDSLVISSDVGVRAAFPESKGKGGGNESVSSGNVPGNGASPTALSSDLHVFLSNPPLFVPFPSLAATDYQRWKETWKLPQSFCRQRSRLVLLK